jgi:uncharacterized repeat protein (TIGR04138 family)
MDYDLQLLVQILEKEKKYSVEAYLFVREGLAFAADHLELDTCADSVKERGADFRSPLKTEKRHVTGQQLCEGIREYALGQFGYMSKTVLNSWGIETTSDIGAIVYKMINAGIMKKSSQDRRSHFDNVFDFNDAFEEQFDFNSTCSAVRRTC